MALEPTVVADFRLWLDRRLTKLWGRGSLRGQLAFGSFWSITGAVLPRALTLPASILCARWLGKTGFGELAIIQSTVGMAAVFAGLGLGMTATKYVAEWREKDPPKAGRILAISTLLAAGAGGSMALLLYLLAPLLAQRVLAAPQLVGPLALGAALLWLGSVNGAQTGALSGLEAFKTMALVNLMSGVCLFPMLVGGVLGWGLEGAVWGLLASAAVDLLLNNLALRRECARAGVPYSFSGCWREWPVLWKFSLPSFLCGSIGGPVAWSCSTLLVNQPNGYAELGIFNAANQWRMALLFIPFAVGQVLIPILANQLGAGNRRRAGKILRGAVVVNAILITPAVLILGLLSSTIMAQYGQDFAGSGPVLLAVLATAALLSIQVPVGHVMAASGKMWTGFAMNLGWGLVVLSAAYCFLKYRALGLALAYGIGYVVHGIWTFGYAWWLLRDELADKAAPEAQMASDNAV